jgi:molybdopterin-guanine dinucleotide biosynthesis protein A
LPDGADLDDHGPGRKPAPATPEVSVPAKPADVPPPSAFGIVLAGGASSRMGTDKRTVDVEGEPLLRRAVGAVATVCDEVLVATSQERPVDEAFGARVVADARAGGCGPLAGLEVGLLASRRPAVLVLAGDHPAGAPAVLRELLLRLEANPEVDAVVLGTDHGPQPLVGAYRRTAHREVTTLLDRGERRARALLDVLRVEVLEEASWRALDPAGGTAVDLDTPEELAAFRIRT